VNKHPEQVNACSGLLDESILSWQVQPVEGAVVVVEAKLRIDQLNQWDAPENERAADCA
jgi:hypothetical protein